MFQCAKVCTVDVTAYTTNQQLTREVSMTTGRKEYFWGNCDYARFQVSAWM